MPAAPPSSPATAWSARSQPRPVRSPRSARTLLAAMGVPRLTALQSTFLLYALLGFACCRGLPDGARRCRRQNGGHRQAPLGPSRGIVLRLAALFSVDSFAGGLAVQSLLALWLFERFGLSLAEAGLFFFWSGMLSAFSFPVAAWLAGRIGLVNTMVFTHIPSSLCLIAAALRADRRGGARAAAAARRAVADGRADPHLLRHGGGDAGRADRGGELHRRAAQPGRRGEPGAGRGALRRRRTRTCRWSPAAC